jgi:hypothetical protein
MFAAIADMVNQRHAERPDVLHTASAGIRPRQGVADVQARTVGDRLA